MNVSSPSMPHTGNRTGVELVGLIGEAATIALAEQFGGTRLYVPMRTKDTHPIARAIGRHAAVILCGHYGPSTIRIPLLREMRAKHYRNNGLSNAKIAVCLGLTESGVGTLFKRLEGRSS